MNGIWGDRAKELISFGLKCVGPDVSQGGVWPPTNRLYAMNNNLGIVVSFEEPAVNLGKSGSYDMHLVATTNKTSG